MVYFVGAGPGDVELITVKGAKILNVADCIIYAGSLVNPELLNYAKKGCAMHNSAKMTLEAVTDIMLKNEKLSLITVRLHTGDPSIYGAIKEQIDILEKNNIPYRVIPGVSSFAGAAAALGVEYTLPGVPNSHFNKDGRPDPRSRKRKYCSACQNKRVNGNIPFRGNAARAF